MLQSMFHICECQNDSETQKKCCDCDSKESECKWMVLAFRHEVDGCEELLLQGFLFQLSWKVLEAFWFILAMNKPL